VAIPTAELNRRVQVTATKSWGPTPAGEVGREVDSQVAAPTETRTPNLHRANIAHQRVRMEGWRQGRLGSREDHSTTKGNYKTDLTLTGLLMEGLGISCRVHLGCSPYCLFSINGSHCESAGPQPTWRLLRK
jgi:hypothetical protein